MSTDVFIVSTVKSSTTFRKEFVKCHDPPIKVGQTTIVNRQTAAAAWPECLVKSADGYGLPAHKNGVRMCQVQSFCFYLFCYYR